MTEYYIEATRALAALAQDRKALDQRLTDGSFVTGSRVARNNEMFYAHFGELLKQEKWAELKDQFDIITNFPPKEKLSAAADKHEKFENSATAYKLKHNEWENKITGIIKGYENENTKAHKHLEKGRRVDFKSADIRIEKNDYSAKSYQLKYTGSTKIAEINNNIIDAIEQLTGLRKERPEPDDALVAEVAIGSVNNSWPFLGQSSLAHYDVYSKEDLTNSLKKQLASVSKKVKCYTVVIVPEKVNDDEAPISNLIVGGNSVPFRNYDISRKKVEHTPVPDLEEDASEPQTENKESENAEEFPQFKKYQMENSHTRQPVILQSKPSVNGKIQKKLDSKLENLATRKPAPTEALATTSQEKGPIDITLKIVYHHPILIKSDEPDRKNRPYIVSKLVISLTLKENRQFDFALEDERCTPPLTSTLNMLEGLPLHGEGIDSSEPTVMNTEN